jgi:cytochrome oxidase Cu insertion factor (SCO1/SenC/PrrC family)
MRRFTGGLLALLVLLPALWAQDKDKPKADDSPNLATELQNLRTEVSKAQSPLITAIREAKSEADRAKAMEAYYKKAEEFAPKFLELAKNHAKDPMVSDVLIQVVSTGGSSPTVDDAIAILLADHESKLAMVCQRVARGQGNGPAKLMRAVLERSKDGKAQAQACIGLGQNLKAQADKLVQQNKQSDADKLSAEAEKFFTMVKDKYAAEAGPALQQAEAELFEMKNLSVGKQAPEIEAEDTDGNKFKLSDYRGKVILLDFWGHW